MEQVTDSQLYPTEMVDLPSKGIFYPENSPLRSGQIELKYMTTKEEDILTSTNLIQKGIVLDKLMDSLIVTKGVKSSDLLIGDLNAVMVASRILGYGKDYQVGIKCPSCSETMQETIDLTSLKTINEPTSTTPKEITLILPASKAEVTLKILSRGDEFAIEKEVKSLKKASDTSSEFSARLRAMITSVNGDNSKATIWKFVENMLVRDSRYIRDSYKEHVPDVDFDIPVTCESCGTSSTVRLPIGTGFFWPDSGV